MNYLPRLGWVTAVALTLQTAALSLSAGSVSIEGVLANSGEQGEALARFQDGKESRAIGLVYDGQGSIWSSGIDGEIIRFTVDGRQLASYRTPAFSGQHTGDRMALCGDALLIKINKALYALPLDAEPGSQATPLKIEATRMSAGTHEGWAAAASGDKVFWVNSKGETREIGTADGLVTDLAVGPEGEVYIRTQGEMLRRRQIIKINQPDRPYQVPGSRSQWVNGTWFGFDWHGTIRRFNRSLEPDPGVVLGGNSGSFIGYVPGNYELAEGRGITWLGGNQYAVVGGSGVVHLLVWSPQERRFEIVRRIGPLKNCRALALDGKGRIWFNGGILQWNDGPDAPLLHGIPRAGAEGVEREPFAAAVMPNDTFIAPIAPAKGAGTFCSGTLDGPAKRYESDVIRKEHVAAALVTLNKRSALLMVDATGAGAAVYVSTGGGRPQGKAGDVVLQGATSIQKLTSLASDGKDRLWAGADGQVLEFAREQDQWRETKRWKQWAPGGELGAEVHLAWSDGRLWVADTEKHCVLVFDTETGELLARVGTEGKPGNALVSFDAPRTLTANGERAIVFDSGNQRLVKMRWEKD